jgi:hypothetical protein
MLHYFNDLRRKFFGTTRWPGYSTSPGLIRVRRPTDARHQPFNTTEVKMSRKLLLYSGKELDRVIREKCAKILARASPAFARLDLEAWEGLREKIRVTITSDANPVMLAAYVHQAEVLAVMARARQLPGRPFGPGLRYLDEMLAVDDRYPEHPLADFVPAKLKDPRDWLVFVYGNKCEYWDESPTTATLTALSLLAGNRPRRIAGGGEYTFSGVFEKERKAVSAAMSAVPNKFRSANARSAAKARRKHERNMKMVAAAFARREQEKPLPAATEDVARADPKKGAEKRRAVPRRGSRLFKERLKKPNPDGGGTGGRSG